MPRYRTKIKHLLILLFLGYGCSVWLLHKSAKKPTRHVSSKFRVEPREADASLKKFIKKLPMKERFAIERRHISYNLKLDQKDAFNFTHCGMWPSHYLKSKQLQAPTTATLARIGKNGKPVPTDNTADRSPMRILIHSCGGHEEDNDADDDRAAATGQGLCGELSDRLLSAASLFVYSLLTDREFFLDWQGRGHSFRSILRTPFLDLNPPPPAAPAISHEDQVSPGNPQFVSLQDWDAEMLDAAFRIQSTSIYLDTSSSSRRDPPSRSQDQHQQQLQQHAIRIRDLIAKTPQLKMHLNRGLAQRFLTDPSYSDQLESIGLRQYNTYECVLSFLFRPTYSIQELIHQYRAVFKTPGVITIGIHIPSRAEQQPAQPRKRLDLFDFDQSIPCAQSLSRAIRQKSKDPDARFLYVILTDSDMIRQQVQEQYGQQLNLIFAPPTQPRASLSFQRQQQYRSNSNANEEDSLERRGIRELDDPSDQDGVMVEDEESTLFQSYLFSETDYQIVTTTGFSKLALFRKGVAGRRTAVLVPSKEELKHFNESEDSEGTKRGGFKMPDCSRLEDAVVSWDMIASFGSLG